MENRVMGSARAYVGERMRQAVLDELDRLIRECVECIYDHDTFSIGTIAELYKEHIDSIDWEDALRL